MLQRVDQGATSSNISGIGIDRMHFLLKMSLGFEAIQPYSFQHSKLVCISKICFKQRTLSANIRAPASMTNSCDSSSFTTAAVKPAAELAFPDVYTARGEKLSTCLEKGRETVILLLVCLE